MAPVNKEKWPCQKFQAGVAACKAFHVSLISSKTCAFCSCNTALSGVNASAASHFPSAATYFPSSAKLFPWDWSSSEKAKLLPDSSIGCVLAAGDRGSSSGSD